MSREPIVVSARELLPVPCLVRFNYKGAQDREPISRMVIISDQDETYLKGIDFAREGQFRSFIRKNVVGNEVWVIGILLAPEQFIPEIQEA